MAAQPNISTLLAAPSSPQVGCALMEWASAIPGRVLRGDMMIGILSVEEAEKVPEALLKAAECGVGEALIQLAKWHTDPAFGEPDLTAAQEALRSGINKRVPGAGLALAQLQWFHRREEALPPEREEAYHISKILAEENGPDAMCLLGQLTHAGWGTTADPIAALELQQRAADSGSADAMFEVYAILASGAGVPKDEGAAFASLQRAAEAGHSRALYNMGAYTATGRFVPKSLAKAAEWYERASGAGNSRATVALAVMYATGDGVPKDLERAKMLFDEAEYAGVDVSELRESVGL